MSKSHSSLPARGAQARPAPPPGGLPPQKTPRWLAHSLKWCVFPFMFLDISIQKLIFHIHPPPYLLKGQCKQRGNCCYHIFMEWPPLMDRWPILGRFWLWWYTDVHGFFMRSFEFENEDGRVAKVMSCRYLQDDGRCGNYRVRPAICRQWPRQEYSSGPHVLKGCGYSIELRDKHEHQEPFEV